METSHTSLDIRGVVDFSLQDYRQDLEKIIKFFNEYRLSQENVSHPLILKNIHKLESLARDHEKVSIAYLMPWFDSLAHQSRRIYGQWETLLEFQEANRLISYPKKNLIENQQIERTLRFAREEGMTAGLHKESRVAFVGSGPFHESAIAIHSAFGCRVSCFDYDEEAVKVSRQLNRNFGLDDSIEIHNNIAEKVSYDQFDTVWMAVLTKNKGAVLDRIFTTAPKAKVVCRTVRESRVLLYEGLEQKVLDRYEVIERVQASDRTTIMHSLVLKR